jgi:site-specific DNA-methyltransferase (adenine-specific)
LEINLFAMESSFNIYNSDCVEQMKKLPDKSINMVFADPPYFLSTGKKRVWIKGAYTSFDKGDWDRARSTEEKNAFNRTWIAETKRLLKDDGTIWICGSYHNIFSVATCLDELSFKILNIVVWNKTDPPNTYSNDRLGFSAEYIIWARKHHTIHHYYNYDLMQQLNGGKVLTDVWRIPATSLWEKKLGKHPTQKPLHLLYRIILASTRQGDIILDPFAGSCTTGIAANLLDRNFIGIDQSQEYLDYGIRRRKEIDDPVTAQKIFHKMAENPDEVMVIVNHCRKETKQLMIEKGICYLRAGDSKGSLLVTSGFERMQYILLHTNGEDCHLFKLNNKGHFQIWTKETLEQYGFFPKHAPYYVVLHFDNTKEIGFTKQDNLKQCINTYRAKIRPLSDFTGIKLLVSNKKL